MRRDLLWDGECREPMCRDAVVAEVERAQESLRGVAVADIEVVLEVAKAHIAHIVCTKKQRSAV